MNTLTIIVISTFDVIIIIMLNILRNKIKTISIENQFISNRLRHYRKFIIYDRNKRQWLSKADYNLSKELDEFDFNEKHDKAITLNENQILPIFEKVREEYRSDLIILEVFNKNNSII